MGWLLRGLPWQAALLIGLGLLGYAGYRLAGHQTGVGTLLFAAAGALTVARSLARARSKGRRP